MKQKFLLKSLLLLCALIAGSSSVWAQETLWSEDFSSYENNAVPEGGAFSYACTNGTKTSGNTNGGNTYVTTQQVSFISPELLVGKKGSGDGAKGGSFTAVIPLNNIEGTLTLTYYQNKQTLKVSSTTVGVSGGQTLKPTEAGQQTTTFTGITTSMTSITIVFEATTTSNVRLDNIVLTGNKATSVATPSFSPAGGIYTSSQNVELSCTTNGASIYYTLDGSTPTSSSTPYTSKISVSETMTIKAIAIKGSDESNVASATYTIYPVLHEGTEDDPYTVADARNAIDANTGLTDVYVSGIVCVGGSELSSGAMNYWISDDGTETNKFEIYKGKGLSGAGFSSTDDVKEGDAVVVKGTIKKFGTVYEFESGSQLVSLTPSANPLISVTPSSLTGFTYGVGFGPSEAQTFSVEGSNLTANITLSLGVSDFEMSLTEGGSYTNSLTLTQEAGAVAATTIYVRLKAGLDIDDSYEGTVTLTSTDATNKTVSLAGSVTQPCFTWDLSTNQTATASEDELTWTSAKATMRVEKGTSTTNSNNYYPGTSGKNYTSTRFYRNEILTIAPTSGYTITSIEFTATSDSYATALENSTWKNATAAASSTTVTVTPTNGALPISATIGATCGFTAVKVYYGVVTQVPLTPAKEYTTLTSSHNLDFTSVSSVLEAYIATEVSGGSVKMTQVYMVPAGTGLVLKATTPGSAVGVPVFDGIGADNVSANKMAGSATATTHIAENGGYILSDGVFQPASDGYLPAGKAYLNIAVTSAPVLELNFGDATAIEKIANGEEPTANGQYYNLNGQRVAQPTKGLYIVNGKKVIIK